MLRNPEGLRSVMVDDYRRIYAGDPASGAVTFTPAELHLLDPRPRAVSVAYGGS